MADNQGLGLAQSEPLMRITDAVASIGRMVQQGEVPQSVKDAWESVKKHVSDAQTSVEDTAKAAAKKVSDAIAPKVKAEELLTNKQGPELPKSSQPGVMSQAEFATALKAKYPKLEGYTDSQIVNAMIAKRPDIADKVENPARGDAMAAQAQSRLEAQSKSPSYIDPQAWQNHPIMKQLIQGATGSLPGIGAIGGAVLAGPETMGLGSLPAAVAGTGVGAGARDYIDMLLGLSQTSPLQKAGNIAGEAGLAAITPGLTEAILNPKFAIKEGAKSALKVERNWTPPLIRKLLMPGTGFLHDLANMKVPLAEPRPAWQSWPEWRQISSSLEEAATKPNVTPANSSLPEPKGKFSLSLGPYIRD